MAFARDVSDKILFMDDGVVAAQGTSEEIFGSHENTRLQAFLTSFYNNPYGDGSRLTEKNPVLINRIFCYIWEYSRGKCSRRSGR